MTMLKVILSTIFLESIIALQYGRAPVNENLIIPSYVKPLGPIDDFSDLVESQIQPKYVKQLGGPGTIPKFYSDELDNSYSESRKTPVNEELIVPTNVRPLGPIGEPTEAIEEPIVPKFVRPLGGPGSIPRFYSDQLDSSNSDFNPFNDQIDDEPSDFI